MTSTAWKSSKNTNLQSNKKIKSNTSMRNSISTNSEPKDNTTTLQNSQNPCRKSGEATTTTPSLPLIQNHKHTKNKMKSILPSSSNDIYIKPHIITWNNLANNSTSFNSPKVYQPPKVKLSSLHNPEPLEPEASTTRSHKCKK